MSALRVCIPSLPRRRLVDSRRSVGRIDLAAEEYGHRDLASDESEAAILQRVFPVESRHRAQRALKESGRLLVYDSVLHAGGYQVARDGARGTFQMIGVDGYVVTRVDVAAHGVDLGHSQSYGRLTLAFGGKLLVLRGLYGGVLGSGYRYGLFEREHAPLVGLGRRREGRQRQTKSKIGYFLIIRLLD